MTTAATRSEAAVRRFDRFKQLVALALAAVVIGWALVARGCRAVPAPGLDPFPETVTAGEPFVLSGTGIAGRQVQVMAGDRPIGATTVAPNGAWNLTAVVPEPGRYTLRVDTIDDAGEVLASANAPTPLVVAAAVAVVNTPTPAPTPTTAPTPPPGETPTAVPALETPTVNWDSPPQAPLAADDVVALGGRAQPGAALAILVDGREVGRTAADETGAWQWQSTPAELALEPGAHDLAVAALGPDGARVDVSQPLPFAVAAAPELVEPPIVNPPSQEDAMDGRLALSGRGAPGGEVELTVDGTPIGRVVVGADGVWQAAIPLTQAGTLQIGARALTADGRVAAEAAPIPFEVTAEMLPPLRLLAALERSGRFTTLLRALDFAGLTATLDGPGPFTLFAPDDDAFAGLPEGVVNAWLADRLTLQRVLLQHVAPGRFAAADLTDVRALGSITGAPISVAQGEDGLMIGGVRVTAADQTAVNGIYHVVDQVILPPSAVPAPVIDGSGVATFRGRDLTVVGTGAPGTTLLLTLNGRPFGEPATVDANGAWLVRSEVEPGEYIIYAFTLLNDVLLTRSNPLALTVLP